MPSTPAPRAAGFILAVAIIAGAFFGATRGQPSLGLLAGLGIGIVASVLLWLFDRRRG